MEPFDIVLMVILVVALVYGLWRGFVRISIGIAGLAISLALALRLAGSGPSWFKGVFSSPQLARLAAFALVLVLGLILTALVSWGMRKLVAAAELSWVDRLLGGLVGFVGASLLISGGLIGMTVFFPGTPQLVARSAIAGYAIKVADLGALILPSSMADIYRERRGQLSPAIPPGPEDGVEEQKPEKASPPGKKP